MSEQTVNIGLIGTGRIGRIHAQNLATRIPEANLVAVADVVLESAEEVGARFGVSNIFEDYQEILEDREVRAVAICSSTNTHAQIIQDAPTDDYWIAAAGVVHFGRRVWVDHSLFSVDRGSRRAKLQDAPGHLLRSQLIGLDGLVCLGVSIGTLGQQ